MPPPAVQKHICEKGPQNQNPQFIQATYLAEPDLIRYQSVCENELLRLPAVVHKYRHQKNQNIDQYEQRIDNWETL